MEIEGTDKLSSSVAELLGRLKLTAAESDAVAADDVAVEGLATSELAIIGKVLSASVLHIQTIASALKPAWGNPKGLQMKSVGDNIFIAEFNSRQDLDRVLDGSPWNVGNKAVLLQLFDPKLRPSEVVFDKMATWIRIYDLPLGLMNKKWGWQLAKKVGSVVKVEVDNQDRAWGPFLRAKVEVDLSKPLLRYVTIFSEKRKTTYVFDVKYEKLPNYCYSCGLIGHSSVQCPNPSERDENGLLPYGKNLRVIEDNKKKGFDERQLHSGGTSFNSGRLRGSCDGQQGIQATQKSGGSSTTQGKNKDEQGASSPLKENLGKENMLMAAEKGFEEKGNELIPIMPERQGIKRKQSKVPFLAAETTSESPEGADFHDAMAIIIANPVFQTATLNNADGNDFTLGADEGDSINKMKRSVSQKFKLSAVAARQPRREP